MSSSKTPVAPVAAKVPHRIAQLGRVRIDDYAWMKDDNWQQVLRDPKTLRADVRDHLDAENAFTKAVLADTEALQAEMFAEMKGRIKEDDSSVPSPDGPYDYYSRYAIGAEHPIHARRPRGQADGEKVLLDEDALAKGKAFFQVGAASHSPDHALYAWAADEQGSEYYQIRVKDLATCQEVGQPIESAYGDFTFSPDSQWIFWIWRDENARPAKVFRRPARGGDDTLVYEERDDGMFLGVGAASDDSHILIHVGNQETTEILLIPATDPTAAPVVAEPRRVGVKYSLDHWTDRWVIRTNDDEAVDFKLAISEAAVPAKATWRDWIAHQPGRYITGFAAFAGHLVRAERVNALDRLVVMARGGDEHIVDFDEEAYALNLEGGYEYDTTVTRFVYQSPTTPRQTFDYDMASRERTLRKTQEIPSGHDPSRYVARRLTATAPDGAEVPITLLMLKDTPQDGTAPVLLYGYGSYGHAMEPSFSIRNLSLVDRGWIWATAHIRGGSDKGWGWFLDGRKDKKPNTFTDFIACAEHLAAEGYGSKGRIAAYGGSAGGMLMGAVANLRPDLWGAIIAAVPFVDVLNTMSDTTLPLTPPEWPEWGNPIDDAAAYDLIEGYSPYDRVSPQAYPPILATGGLSDPRVTYWEPAKWVAKLREHTTGDAPILLKINMEAGHGGASGRFDFLKEIALDYAFAVWALKRT
ncbi:MAG: S9 family peptidase [Alphaproteobacteria bacterium]|nr:S9 family peptidase [Alphaproteobacteria bacterium]MBU1512768.1 S9 family peptidase [Alphaproteobacteria bacterium]MBU2096553.1 S9 family peptidase [Alphaproteobacteria bacterium]MBU2151921.1 S9 family peptidase [Alphaproteobacteria bacterium]MBU2306431.1 S9 family peptidase [Alphaproteobacteria bacterium]